MIFLSASFRQNFSKAWFLTLAVVLVANPLFTGSARAITSEDLRAINLGVPVFYGGSAGSPMSCAGGGSGELDGHKLPATKGGTGIEEPIDEQGRVPSTGKKIAFHQHADHSQEYRDYYITMRWRYRTWNWNGTSSSGPEDVDFYAQAPKVLVTNPRTGNSIIAVVLEAGPAPWTGVDRFSNNDPKQGWVNPQDGTPLEYKGRVSGFPPTAIEALGAAQKMYDGSGDDLLYQWAPDQDATPGPTDLVASPDGAGCPATGGIELIEHIVFTGSEMTNVSATVLHWTAGIYDDGVDGFVRAIRSNTACGANGCSVQLFVDTQGKVYQLTDPLETVSAHAAGINSNAIGIEIEGRGESDLLGNDAQFEAVVNTVIYLVSRYDISLVPDVESKSGILGHFETDVASYGPRNGKQDPGETYLGNVREEVNRRMR